MRARLLVLPLVLAGCATAPPGPAAPVTAAEARAAVDRAVELAAEGTSAAMRELCAQQGCAGLSSSIPFEPARAPRDGQSPRQVCAFPLPPTPGQAGARLLVLAGTAGDGRPYVSQVLVERGADGVELHEPGFWLGIRYTALSGGRAWSGSGDGPEVRARDDAAALRACDDRAAWLDEVTGS